jgi:hypothetical protein
VLLFILVFVCSTPLGVMIGMLSQSQDQSDGQIVASGAAEAIGTGSLLYVALVEMLPDLFNREHGSLVDLCHLSSKPASNSNLPLKDGPGSPAEPNPSGGRRGVGPTMTAIRILGISLGVAFMALLAVWA